MWVAFSFPFPFLARLNERKCAPCTRYALFRCRRCRARGIRGCKATTRATRATRASGTRSPVSKQTQTANVTAASAGPSSMRDATITSHHVIARGQWCVLHFATAVLGRAAPCHFRRFERLGTGLSSPPGLYGRFAASRARRVAHLPVIASYIPSKSSPHMPPLFPSCLHKNAVEQRTTQEFVHADCLARWVCTKSSGGPGRRKQPGQCDVCKKHLSGYDRFRPGYLVGVKNAAIRLLQLYIVSTTAIGGMETAVNSVMASIVASSKDAAMGVGDSGVDGDQSASASRAASNLVKFLTGVCVVRTIVFRRADDLFFVFKVFRRVARAAFLGLEASSVRLVVV